MKIRIYYSTVQNPKLRGEILLTVIEGSDGWNLLECGKPVVGNLASDYATFELTEDNLKKYFESPNRVNMETISEVKGKL